MTCSPTENADLFCFAMGGYGMFGIITELEMDMVPNARLEPTFETMQGTEFGEAFLKKIRDNTDIQMAYGRMSIAIDGFFDEALMITYKPNADQTRSPAARLGLHQQNFARHFPPAAGLGPLEGSALGH